MSKHRPNWASEDAVPVLLWMEKDIHASAKRCAAIERRTLQAFASEAVAEKVRRMIEEDISDSSFIPPGLRGR